MNAIIALCHFCDNHGPQTLFCTQAFKFVDKHHLSNDAHFGYHFHDALSSSPRSSNSNCRACRGFDKPFEHYISYDDAAKLCYISQSAPSDSEIFVLVRKACLRTLHCEVFEDPIYFDDDKNVSVIGYEFRIKDSEGRGSQRSYAIVVIMKDRIYLQHLWAFMHKHMSLIAARVKEAAQRFYDKEVSANLGFLVKKGSAKGANRSLGELTDDEQIFAKLHMWFTWILRTSTLQISEKLLQGPVVEDLQIRFERAAGECESPTGNVHIFDNSTHTLKLSGEEFRSSAESDDACHLEFVSYRDLIRKIGAENFHVLAYHVVVGNQVIVRNKYQTLVASVLRLFEVILREILNLFFLFILFWFFEELIPYGCRKTVFYSHEYVKAYECNLLGLSQNFDLSTIDNYVSDDFALLDLQVFKTIDHFTGNFEASNGLLIDRCGPLDSYRFKVTLRTPSKPDASLVPQVLTKIEAFLLNDSLDPDSIHYLIIWTREEWLK